MEVILLLTACIRPNVTDYIAIPDYTERKNMYIDAINWYINNTNFKIIFVENSGVNIKDEIISANPNRIEFLTFNSKPTIPERSRSYKEMEILEYAFDNSTFLKKEDLLIVKITGRLKLLNINAIIKALIKTSRKTQGFVSSAKNARKPFSDCRFIYFSKNFWPYLHKQKENIWPTYGMEWVLGDAIREAQKNGITFIYPPLYEDIEGIGMSQGHSLKSKGVQLLKKKIKHTILAFLFNIKVLPLK